MPLDDEWVMCGLSSWQRTRFLPKPRPTIRNSLAVEQKLREREARMLRLIRYVSNRMLVNR